MKVMREPTGLRWPWIAAALVAAAAAAWAVRARTVAGVDPDRLWNEAETDFQAGRYDRTEASLARLARLREPTGLDWILRAQVAMVRRRDDEAIADLARVPEGHRMAAQARLLAGQLELRRKRVRKAESWLLEATRLDPALVQAHRELVYIYGMQLRRPELSARFRTLAGLTPLSYDNVWHWCLTRNSLWEPREIVDELRRYVEADPEDRESRLALADNLRRLSRWTEAESTLAPITDADPDARAVRARIALDRGDDATAEELLAGGAPGHAELARMRGRLALARRDGPAAVKHFQAALAADPDHRDAVFGLGQALAMAGDPAAAAPYIAAARDHDALGTLMQRASTPEGRKDPELMRALGAACEKIHRTPEARAWYDLAIRTNPLDQQAQKALFRLRTGEARARRSS